MIRENTTETPQFPLLGSGITFPPDLQKPPKCKYVGFLMNSVLLQVHCSSLNLNGGFEYFPTPFLLSPKAILLSVLNRNSNAEFTKEALNLEQLHA